MLTTPTHPYAYRLFHYLWVYRLPKSLLSRWPVVSKINAAIIDYRRIFKAAVQQSMRVYVKYKFQLLSEKCRDILILRTPKMSPTIHQGGVTVTWAMPRIATYTSSCFLYWHFGSSYRFSVLMTTTTEGMHPSPSINTHHHTKESTIARLLGSLRSRSSSLAYVGQLGFENWLAFLPLITPYVRRDCGAGNSLKHNKLYHISHFLPSYHGGPYTFREMSPALSM